jgi:hypothetical protein
MFGFFSATQRPSVYELGCLQPQKILQKYNSQPGFGARKRRFRAHGFNGRCDFIPYNNHKMMSNRHLWICKTSALLENYNFLYN